MPQKKDVQTGSGLSTRIILMVETILLITGVLFCTVSVYSAREDIRKAITQRMLDIANCAAGSISGDTLHALSATDVGSSEYNDLYGRLAVFRDNAEIEYIYSLKQTGKDEFIFTMDTDPESPAAYGDSVEYTHALGLAGYGVAAVDDTPYTDRWGKFYSAYSPVFDSDGSVAGIIGVDFSADWYDGQLSEQMRSTIFSHTIILIISLLLAAILSLITVKPYVKAQGELLEEKVKAESANLVKSEFLANMSHEIRTPINAMLGMNEMILRESRNMRDSSDKGANSKNEAVRNIVGYASEAESAGHNLLAIINDVLDFSKIDAGEIGLAENPYRISSMINGISSVILPKARDKGLNFIIETDSSIPDNVIGDEIRVRQIFINLLNNAVKYTEEGYVTMTLGGRRTGDDTFLLTASVKDSGIGIKEEDLEKLFGKFQRLEMDRNSTLEGTGIGLVITQRLLLLMGGSINVTSEYGKGSEFSIKIPQKLVSGKPIKDIESEPAETEDEEPMKRESFLAPSARILVVDDTLVNLTVVTHLLKKTQMVIDTATSGAKSVEMAKGTRYDVILMDQRMPGMDGTEALHTIRSTAEGKSSDSPIICFTADAVVGARERYLAEGFSDYITKPVDSYALEKMILRYLPQDKIKERVAEGA